MDESGKIRQALYDEVIEAPDAAKECDVCLTIGQVRWILSQVDYAGWKTRYYLKESTEIDQDKIDAMRDDLIERLFMTCCGDIQEVQRRVNPDTGVVEVSTNGGLTWIPDPQDPRNSGVALPPPVTSGVAVDKCAAANSVTKQLQVYVEDIITSKTNELGLIEIALGIAAALLLILVAPAWALLPTLIIPLISHIFNATVSELVAAMSSTTYEQFTCIIYCNMQADGTMTEAGFVQAINDMNTQMADGNPLGYNTCRAFMLIYSLLGVNNAAAQGLNYGFSCDDCGCGVCDWSGWEIWNVGTIISQTTEHIVIEAVETVPGTWNLDFRNVDIFACCCHVVFEYTGTPPTAIGYVPCGLANDDQTNMGFSYSSQSANGFAMAGNAAFTVEVTGQNCTP